MITLLDPDALLKLYPEYSKVYISVNREKRRIVLLYRHRSKRTTISYARAIMEVYLGYRLSKELEVDHINNIKTDDRVENLKVITGTKNKNKTRKLKTKICFCGKEFKPERETQKYCSDTCRYNYVKPSNQYTKK